MGCAQRYHPHMEFTLRGKAEQVVQQAIARGEYASAEQMMEEALLALQGEFDEDFILTPEAEGHMARGMAQAERGEGRDWREVVSELRAEIRRA
jgi:hypothetical protein